MNPQSLTQNAGPSLYPRAIFATQRDIDAARDTGILPCKFNDGDIAHIVDLSIVMQMETEIERLHHLVAELVASRPPLQVG